MARPVVVQVAATRQLDFDALWLRVVFTFLTESSIRNLANDGGGQTQWGLTDAQVAVLRTSLDYPNDGVGSNGKSTGIAQQVSLDVNRLRGITWGWGSLADTMDVAKATRMLALAMGVTTDATYRGRQMCSPVVADVLRCQGPSPVEATSDNYSSAQLDRAIVYARNGK